MAAYIGNVVWLLVVVNVIGVFTTGSVVRMSAKEDRIHRSKDVNTREHTKPLPHKDPRTGTFSLAKHFQNYMVLQKAPARAKIYGFSSEIGENVYISMWIYLNMSYNYVTVVQPGPSPGVGVWSVDLDPMEAGISGYISARSQDLALTISDIIFGDVWVCSGQSNMQFTTIQMFDAAAEIADANNYPNIRLMTVNENTSSTPLLDLPQIQQNWTRADNISVGGPAWQYFSAVCWLFGKAIHKATGYPVGLVDSAWGGTPVEAWSSPEALAKCGIHQQIKERQPQSYEEYIQNLSHDVRQRLNGPDDNSVLWNAMIHPLLNMTIYGVIWYQGEADASGDRMNKYNCTFPTMIRDWRQNFHLASGGQTNATFPFGFVQLSANSPDPSITVGFPDIRWHQTADHGYVPNPDMPQTFMAVAMDLPDFNSTYGSIHPRDKKDVGARLSLAGLAVAYGQTQMFQGPFPTVAQLTTEGLEILYGKEWELEIRDKFGFEILCSDKTWVAAEIVNSDSQSVTVQADLCPRGDTAEGVRYAWRESPCAFKTCAVYEAMNGLPGAPFIAYATTRHGLDGGLYFDFRGPVHI